MSEIPTGFVPLPEVENYPSVLSVNNLGLPVGMPEDSVEVNLRAFSRVQKAAALGPIIMQGYSGEQSSVSAMPMGNNGGVASAARVVTETKARLGSGHGDLVEQKKPTVFIRINTSELHARCQDDRKYPKGALDPRNLAKQLSVGTKQALRDTAKQRLLPTDEVRVAAFGTAILTAQQGLLVANGMSATGFLLTSLWGMGGASVAFRRLTVPNRPSSLTLACFDRYLLSQAAITSSAFFRAAQKR